MLNPIKEIYNWQKAAGNLDSPYDDFLESAFQIEEALEGFDVSNIVHYSMLRPDLEDPEWIQSISNPKAVSRQLMGLLAYEQDQDTLKFSVPKLSDVERLDKACDAIIFAIGSIAKLGLDHHDITKALNIVNNANKAKLGMSRDEHGKLMKPANFIGPEVHLQALLDTRK